jgi:uroporphyrin-III C-methyltransferase
VKGKVYLVGAGPGDPELLTLKALRLLRSADVVLHDALVTEDILQLALPHARLIDVGKRVGHHRYTQVEINRQMIESARWANVVVRLKGGDPLIFGRAAEEMAALRQAGVEFEIVPGITAATAAAAQARIPLTDRESASCITLATAHAADGRPAVDFASIAATGSTVAIYMPGGSYGEIGRQMIAAGMAPETCCLLVSNACRKNQQLQWTDLRSLRSITPPESPALLIVGEVARCRDESAASTLLQSHDEIVRAISHVAPE